MSGAKVTSSSSAPESQILLLLLAPILAAIAVLLWIWHSEVSFSASEVRVFGTVSSSYATGLFIFLIFEAGRMTVGRRDRIIQLLLGFVGLALAAVTAFTAIFFLEPWHRVLGESVFLAAPSAGMLLQRRRDPVRAAIFGTMGLAAIRSPLVYPLPPFISIGLLAFVAAAFFGLRSRLPPGPVRLRAALQVILGGATTALFLYGAFVAYQRASLSGVLLFSTGALFFGGLTILRILLGDYWWLRHRR